MQSYISFGHGGRVVPALWFKYDLTPITVKYLRKRQPFYSFITKVNMHIFYMLYLSQFKQFFPAAKEILHANQVFLILFPHLFYLFPLHSPSSPKFYIACILTHCHIFNIFIRKITFFFFFNTHWGDWKVLLKDRFYWITFVGIMDSCAWLLICYDSKCHKMYSIMRIVAPINTYTTCALQCQYFHIQNLLLFFFSCIFLFLRW